MSSKDEKKSSSSKDKEEKKEKSSSHHSSSKDKEGEKEHKSKSSSSSKVPYLLYSISFRIIQMQEMVWLPRSLWRFQLLPFGLPLAVPHPHCLRASFLAVC